MDNADLDDFSSVDTNIAIGNNIVVLVDVAKTNSVYKVLVADESGTVEPVEKQALEVASNNVTAMVALSSEVVVINKSLVSAQDNVSANFEVVVDHVSGVEPIQSVAMEQGIEVNSSDPVTVVVLDVAVVAILNVHKVKLLDDLTMVNKEEPGLQDSDEVIVEEKVGVLVCTFILVLVHVYYVDGILP